MDRQISSEIAKWIASHKEEILSDLKKTVEIPSVSQPDSEVKPYGKACRKVLERLLNAGAGYGFESENYHYHVGGIFLNTAGKSAGRIGIWSHLDVVPAGDNWSFPPFSLTEKDGFLIGRGVQDNKCAAVGVLHAFRCINELFPKLRHEYVLYMGCSEENTMDDVRFFADHYKQPDLSLVADCGFPVCYGEKGIIDAAFTCGGSLPDFILAFSSGTSLNTIPDTASVTLQTDKIRPGEKEGQADPEEQLQQYMEILSGLSNLQVSRPKPGDFVLTVTAKGVSSHVIAPKQGKNAIPILLEALKTAGIVTGGEDWFAFLLKVSADGYGEAARIACRDKVSGPLTGTATRVDFSDGVLNISANYRYPIFDGEALSDGTPIIRSLEVLAKAHGFSLKISKNSKPSFYDPHAPAVATLTDTFNKITGLQTKAYTMSGGSYARMLDNAIAFGMSMPGKRVYKEYEGDPRGDYHQANESLNIKDYLKAIEIYIQCILELDKQEI